MHQRVMAHIWISHVTFEERVMLHWWRSHPTHMWPWNVSPLGHVRLEGMSHPLMSHDTYLNASCHICRMCHVALMERVMAPIRHVTHTNASWHPYGMSHTPMRHGTNMNESCHIEKRVMSHRRMSHATHMWPWNVSPLGHKRLPCPWLVPFLYVVTKK